MRFPAVFFLLKYRVFVLLNTGLPFVGVPISRLFLGLHFSGLLFPRFVLVCSANFRSAICSRPGPLQQISPPIGRQNKIFRK